MEREAAHALEHGGNDHLDGGRAGGDWCVFFEALDDGVDDAGHKEDGEDDGVFPGGWIADFDQPPEVNDAGEGCDVDETVETLPVLASHRAHDEGR